MTPPREISDELLNALADHELAQSDRDQLMARMAADSDLQVRYAEICELKKMMQTAYSNLPPSPMGDKNQAGQHNRFRERYHYKHYLSAAALLLMGLSIGWTFNPDLSYEAVSFESYNSLSPEIISKKNVLLHINSMDRGEVELALQTARRLLDISRETQTDFHIEVVANASGLGVLRVGSPYTGDIASLAKNRNIKFMACGIAKKTAMLTEKRDIMLLPEAVEIPAALDQIILRLKDGWTYINSE